MRAFITGIEGFVGKYLSSYLLQKGSDVSGGYFQKEDIEGLEDRVELASCDIRDHSELTKVLRSAQPDQIYHLAAQSSAKASFEDPRLTFEVNVLGTFNLLEAARELDSDVRIIVASSCQVYGEAESPIGEDAPLNPQNPYAASKASAELFAYQYNQSFNLRVIRVRPFNHTGPGQSPVFALSNFAKQIAEIEKGRREPVISVGNLEVRREFLDVRDVIEAYHLIAEGGEDGEVYNISTGEAHSLRDVLDTLLGFSEAEVEVKVVKERLRSRDILLLCGAPDKLFGATGWQPRIPLEQTLKDLLDFWRGRV